MPVCICGELAGDPIGALLMVGLGYRSLSMNTSNVAKIKYLLRHTDSHELQDLATQALMKPYGNEIYTMMKTFFDDKRLLWLYPRRKIKRNDVNIEFLAMLVLLGGVVGIMAGLLGIGGGLIVVPALLFLLPLAGIDPSISMQIALATSLASIIVTSGSSAFNHFKLGNVDIHVVKWLMPGVVVGGFLGANIAEWLPSQYLPKVFGFIVLVFGYPNAVLD